MVTAVTATSHGFATGDMVTISGVQMSSPGKPADDRYLGTFPINKVNDTTFTYPIGASYFNLDMGVPESPQAFGNITCWRERELFDTLMRTMPANTFVHLGPGTFETKGMSFGVIHWMPKSGQKIRGSGIGVTTLKLVRVEDPESNTWAVGSHYYNFVEDFEISDLTVDCNVGGQRIPLVTCGAIVVPGRHIRIRRVRAINFGAHTRGYVENFVIASGAIHPYLEAQGYQSGDCVIEDCILERPSPNPRHNSTMIIFGGGEEGGAGVMAFHHGCVLRNCFVNGQIIYGALVPLPVQSIVNDQTASMITVTTKAPHQLTKPGNAMLRGVTVGGSLDNVYNGVFEIDSIVSPTVFKFRLVTASTPDGGSGFAGGGVTTHGLPVSSIVPDDTLLVCPSLARHSFDGYEERYTITTRDPHNRTMFNNLVLNGVLKPGLVGSNAFNGSFDVVDYDPLKPKEIVCALVNTPDVTSSTQLNLSGAIANVGHIALTGDSGTGAVIEGNRVFHMSAGVFHDTWATTDLIVRNNYFHDVLAGPFQSLNGISSTFVPNSLVSLDYVGSTAKAATAFPHGLRAGDKVNISSAGQNDGPYIGTNTITLVTAPNRFDYAMAATPTGPASGAGYGTIEKVSSLDISPQKRLGSLYYVFRAGKHTAIAKTTWPSHGFAVGDAVRVTKAGQFISNSFETASEFNGNFKITAVPNAKTFEYEISGDPTFDSENQDLAVLGGKGIGYFREAEVGVDSENVDFSAGYFGRIWQVRNLSIENNVIELGVRALGPIYYGWSSGIPMYGSPLMTPQYSLLKVHIRDNVIRNLDDRSAPDTRAIEISGCENIVIEGNIIGVDRERAIEHQINQSVLTFYNTKPDGKLVESTHQDQVSPKFPEVVRKIEGDLEGAMALSLFTPEEEL